MFFSFLGVQCIFERSMASFIKMEGMFSLAYLEKEVWIFFLYEPWQVYLFIY